MTDADIILLPLPEQLRRGVERAEKQVADVDDQPSAPFYAIDTLRRMELKGTISKSMRDAGEQFRTDFSLGQFVPLKAADVSRIPGCGTARQILSGRAIDAKDRVWAALFVLGGLTSPAGQIAWGVLGEQWTLEEWAERGGWNGKGLRRDTAAGILIGALGALESHYEKLRNERRREAK